MKLTLIAAAVAFALRPPTPAAAQQTRQKFRSLDKNGDGKISRVLLVQPEGTEVK